MRIAPFLTALAFPAMSFCQGSSNVTLVYHWNDTTLPSTLAHNNRYNEVWGFTQNEREYAVIGSTMGTHIFDITDPLHVDTTAFIRGAATGVSIVHRDFHDYNGYLYMVCDEDSQLTLSTLQIADLSYLPDSAPLVYSSNTLFRNSHNIFIDSTNAKLYACGVRPSGNRLEIYSLAIPENPVLIETYNRGRHDVYVHDDTAYLNDGDAGLYVVDFETPGNPQVLGSLSSYTDSGYNHSGWLSEDGRYYALADENFGLSIKLLDVSDLSDIQVVSTMNSGVDPLSIPHNLIIRGQYLFASYYNDGMYIFDISDPVNPMIAGYYDTSTEPHIMGKYRGAWGVYPLLPSGLVLVSDMQNGLYVFDVSQAVTENEDRIESGRRPFSIRPNPLEGDELSISLDNNCIQKVYIRIFDTAGRLMLSAIKTPSGGAVKVETGDLPPGVYLAGITSNGITISAKMIKTK